MRALEVQLSAVEAGHVEVLDRHEAIERIREIFSLATSLRADFRRVEDCWRDADRMLRQSMVSGDAHRGAIMEKLLDSHDHLLDTPEGLVFHGVQQQLRRKIELDDMKLRLRTILSHPVSAAACDFTHCRRCAVVMLGLFDGLAGRGIALRHDVSQVPALDRQKSSRPIDLDAK